MLVSEICVDVIDTLETFQAIKTNWDSVYEADPQAQFFLSWVWQAGMSKRYDAHHNVWFVLAARSSPSASEYVAFFPLKIALKEYVGGGFYNELSLAGSTDAEHIGFICLPEYEESVVVAFAMFLQQEKWAVFQLRNIPKADIRLNAFLRSLIEENTEVQKTRLINDVDHIDYNSCPSVALPNDWEQYLQNVLGASTRKQIRRLFRKIEESDEFYVTHTNADNLERHLEVLFGLWKANWEGRKGSDECQKIVDRFSFLLRHCFEHQCLYLPVLWQGDKPLGAQASFIDTSHKTMLCFIGSRDETIQDPPCGIFLHAYSIRCAIQNGLKVYDFLIGNEAYKFSLGAKERQIEVAIVQRKNSLDQARKLNVRTIPEALYLASIYHRVNRLVEAEQTYCQILEVEPQHPDVLYNLGVLMQRKGEHQSAESLFRSLLQVQPKEVKVWFSLGTLHHIQGQLSEAEKAYRQALELHPDSSAVSLAIYHNLGYTLQQQGHWEEAIACYQKARELHPDSIEAEVIWANALYAQGTLPSEEYAHYAALNHELGNRRRQANDFKAAIEYYRQTIAMEPNFAEAYYHLGLALQEQDQNNWEETIACYQKARELQPDYLEATVGLANTLYAQKKLSSEEQSHYAAINHDLGVQCEQVGDLKSAARYYRQAIAMTPGLAEFHYHLGLTLQAQGSWEEAIGCYQKALDIQPVYIEAELSLANTLHGQGKLTPKDQERYAAMNYKVGNQRKQAGDLKSAIEYYRQAVIMNPDLAEVRDQLRLVLEEQDNTKIKISYAKQ